MKSERVDEALALKHCALSLVGEPIMYPHIDQFIDLLHSYCHVIISSLDMGLHHSLSPMLSSQRRFVVFLLSLSSISRWTEVRKKD